MATVNVYLVTALLACVLSVVCIIPPLLSSPGNGSILVFLDVHVETNCTEADWSAFELAQSLLWKHQQETSDSGLHIYDTCRSSDRVRSILYERMVEGQAVTTDVAGIISYTTPGITDLISDSLGLYGKLHVALGTRGRELPGTTRQANELTVKFFSETRIKALHELLQALQWSYVTTLSDGTQLSELEHAAFLATAPDNLCVQYSQDPDNEFQVDMSDIKTTGVVIFASDVDSLEHIMLQIPSSKAVIVVSSNPALDFISKKDGVVVFDKYNTWIDFAKFMSQDLWQQNSTYQMTQDFFRINFNCSYNTSTDAIMCVNTTGIQTHILKTSTGLQMNLLGSVFDLVVATIEEIKASNCTGQRWSDCINIDDIIMNSNFSLTDGRQVSLKSTSLELQKVNVGTVEQMRTFLFSESSTFSSDVKTWLSTSSQPFPSSHCETWCPVCQTKSCDETAQIHYAESYYFIPGDILILGMFPLSSSWQESGDGRCSGVTAEQNTDVLVESFLYAIKTAKLRYRELLPNVTVGAIVLDTCSNPRKALQLYTNFESCLYKFSRIGNSWRPSPYITPVSLTVAVEEHKDAIAIGLGHTKLGLIIDETGNINERGKLIYDSSIYNFEMVVEFLHQMKWTYFGVLRSESVGMSVIKDLYNMTRAMNICIGYDSVISSENDNINDVISTIRDSSANTVVIVATSDGVNRIFRAITSRQVVRNWIIIETRKDTLDISAYPVPLGSIFLKKSASQHDDFNSHFASVYTKNVDYDQNPWKYSFDLARDTCSNCKYPDVSSNSEVLSEASDVIKGVDITLAAIHGAYTMLCQHSDGLCANFWKDGSNKTIEALTTVELQYLDEKIDVAGKKYAGNFIIYNLQMSGVQAVGNWSAGQLTLDLDNVKSYNSLGVALEKPRDSYCITTCQCLNLNNATNKETDVLMFSDFDAEMGYTDSSAEFNRELWTIIVLIIAGTGSLLTMFLMGYIMCKVCSGALVRRYLVLGIMLLVAMICLFMSVIPFVFTPSEEVCGMRYFAHGFSYAFSFAIILTKMTTLRDYKYIGLGGEISRINQLLSVLFITGVQIAVGVQWWVTRTTSVYSQIAFEQEEGELLQKTYYACDFKRSDFLAYHSFVIFLIALCCIYAICVRKETKNMKEARLLLISSWICLAIWVAIIVTLLVLKRELLEAVCAIGLLATAVTMMIIIYLPKLTAISRLKYEVEQVSRKGQNGYKIDPDFQFERPYSLPGTMHTSITDKTLSYPRSIAQFDTSLSY